MRERIRAGTRAAVVTLIAGLLLPANAQAQEEVETRSPNTGLVVFDVMVLRPLGLVALAVGAGAFVPAALLTAPNGREGIETALGIFVTGPANHLLHRPLGDF